jgi:hypothetical protein
MKADIRANGFDHALDGWVRAALVRGVCTFPELVRSLPGVYPADALRAVGRLRQELPADWQLSATPSVTPALDSWPVEHPLDFDWRFTPEAVRLLIDRCHGPAPDSVAFLGAPSLAREAAARGWRAAISLFDQNPALVAAIRASLPRVTAACIDLVWGDPVGAGDAAVAVADPPWYPEHIVAFLWAASRLTRIGGRVLISLPPEGTRPGILAERDAVFAGAPAFGLRLASVEPGALAYRTPPFEKNALASAGIPAVPWDWRRGDLAEFVAVAKTSADRPTPPGPPDVWDEESVGVVRIKCRTCPDNDFRDPTLSLAVPGDMLATVSRRDPARAAVDVWTCGNRVFRCAGTGMFRVIVSALGRGDDVESAGTAAIRRNLSAEEANLVRRAAAQAADLVRREERELAEDAYRRHERDLATAV